MPAKLTEDSFCLCRVSRTLVIYKVWLRDTSLAVQWLGLCASRTGGMGSISGLGTKVLHTVWCDQKKKKKKSWVL